MQKVLLPLAPLVLGVSALYHDSAAALVRGGEILAAAEEERFSRRRHDSRMPVGAIEYCLSQLPAGERLEAVVYYEDPTKSFDRVIRNALAAGDKVAPQWKRAAEQALGQKLTFGRQLRAAVGPGPKLLCVDHHASHAASAYYPSPFDAAAVLVVDGVGEWATTSIGRGEGSHLELRKEVRYPHSLALLYSAFTQYCGFKVNSGEYKLMGLAAFGEPLYAGLIRDRLIDLKPDGSFRLDLRYFSFPHSDAMVTPAFQALFGEPPREPEAAIGRFHADCAASIQTVLEQAMLHLARTAVETAGSRNLCMAGGVALNCIANGKLLTSGIVDNLWIQPAAGDSGGALGAALLAAHRHFGAPRPPRTGDAQKSSLLGPSFDAEDCREALEANGVVYEDCGEATVRNRRIADDLADGHVVGLFDGRMEFGPQALGNRSILADPRPPGAQSRINRRIKFRDGWRPFAPIVLQEEQRRHFNLAVGSPYMLFTAQVNADGQSDVASADVLEDEDFDLAAMLERPGADLPAVTHADGSARVQSVSRDSNPDLHGVLSAFKERAGCGVLVNTSFNLRGEPIVCTPFDAVRCFLMTDMDVLVLGSFIARKVNQPADILLPPKGDAHVHD